MTDCSRCDPYPTESSEGAFEGRGLDHSPAFSRLGDFAVVAGAVLRRTLWWPDGFGAFQAVAFAAAAVGQRVGASVHHDSVHPVGHGEGFQMALNGYGKRQLVYQVHRSAGDDGATAQVLQAEHWKGK